MRKRTGLSLGVLLIVAVAASGADEDCLVCHGDRGTTDDAGRSVFVDPTHYGGSVHAPLGCDGCHQDVSDYPHPSKVARPACGDCHDDLVTQVESSIHGALGDEACTACHGPSHAVEPVAETATKVCADCHDDTMRDYWSSVHAGTAAAGGATCSSCHGPVHTLRPAGDPTAPVARPNLAQTCGACHGNPEFLSQHKPTIVQPVEAYQRSVHGRAIAAGNLDAATCADCHGSHAILPEKDPRSTVNYWAVARTCARCHDEIAKVFDDSIHGQAIANNVREAPTCTYCHGEHSILAPSEPGSLVNPARVSAVTCGRCHADERLTSKFGLSADQVPAFQDSFHGLALRAGSTTVANCASCHGVHNILPSSDPRSMVHPTNLSETCGSCHPGAGQRFTIGPVHVVSDSAQEHVVVRWIRVAYLFLIIPVTIGLMLLHNLIDFVAKLVRGTPGHDSTRTVPRMNLHFRISHAMMAVAFVVLAVTGFALKLPESWWAAPLLAFEGEVAFRGLLHRAAAVLLLASLFHHALHLALARRDRRVLRHLMPGMKDLRDAGGMVLYNLGRRPARPHFGVFSYAEKAEYWALIWGSVVMALSGFILWFNNWSLAYLPKWVSDAATAIHLYEAVLATLSILVWHFYMVIFDPEVYPMDLAWLTGKASADHMQRHRPEYYARLTRDDRHAREDAGPSPGPADPRDPERDT